MNKKIENYVNVLFSDIPKTNKAIELKAEMLSDMDERFNDYISEGKSENEAYSQVVANLGDVDSMLEELKPDQAFKEKIDFYRMRKAKGIAIGVTLYILGVALFFFSAIFEPSNVNAPIYGLIGMFVVAAVATGIIIFVSASVPYEIAPYVTSPDDDEGYMPQGDGLKPLSRHTKYGQLHNTVQSIFWTLITAVYLLVSFSNGAWHISWIIWIIGAVISQIIRLLFLIGAKNGK